MLLTCSDRFDAFADALVVLEGPAVIPAGPRPDPTLVQAVPLIPSAAGADADDASEPDPETGIVDPFRLGPASGHR
jgi:hypothetical protein